MSLEFLRRNGASTRPAKNDVQMLNMKSPAGLDVAAVIAAKAAVSAAIPDGSGIGGVVLENVAHKGIDSALRRKS